MSLNFSALQYEREFSAKSVSNWEYPRFFPPRPRTLKGNSKPIAGKDGHLLPTVPRDGSFLGHYRGTYHLPLRITRSFATLYNSCLSGRHRYWKYPRDLCCCQRERRHPCDFRETLGQKDDPLWQRPICQTKCEGFKQMQAINQLHIKCKRTKCQPLPNEKLVPRMCDASSRYRKKLRKRPVTAFDYNRRAHEEKKAKSQPAKDASKTATASNSQTKSTTAKSTTRAPPKSQTKSK